MTSVRPLQYLLQRKTAEILADGVVDAKEVAELSRLATDSRGSTAAAQNDISTALDPTKTTFASEQARRAANKFLGNVCKANIPRLRGHIHLKSGMRALPHSASRQRSSALLNTLHKRVT